MTQFQFSTIFTTRRKELKLTQEDIAQFVGVSRAAVSKWEKGQSYPDITLLPKLAMYFDLSIDTLLGYEPQLTHDRIVSIYAELAKCFTTEPFPQVESKIERLVTEYYSCYPFLMKMAQLYLNYLQQSPDFEQTAQKIIAICERVKRNSEDLHLLNEATLIEAMTYLALQQPEQVIERLGNSPAIDFSSDILIATALNMLQRPEEAKQITQASTYQKLLSMIAAMTETLTLETENPHYIDETVHRAQAVIELFNVHTININCVLVFNLKAAHIYAMQQRNDKASEMIAQYLKACLKMKFPLMLTGDDYFYLVQDWIEGQMNLMKQAPRDEASIKRDLLGSIDQHPLLSTLLQQPELQMLYKNVQHYLKGDE